MSRAFHRFHWWFATGIAIAGASLVTIPSVPAPATNVQVRAVRLAGSDTADSLLGDGTALVLGASGVPTPSQGWLNAFDALYLGPRGFDGTTQALTTPESLYPFTFAFSQTYNSSTAQGVQAVVDAIAAERAAGGVDAANPVVVTGYSQSSTVDSLVMSELAAQGVPSDDVHFVMVGDPNAPNGGYLTRFDLPAGTNPESPSLGLTFGNPTPSDLYPANVYDMEYDGFADFPQYPINILADLNAYLGIAFNHAAYLGLTPEQISTAVQLPTSGDTLADYYIIPSASLPLLDPLRLVPFAGNPLADLLQPDLSVLVNLGYGNIDHGWSPGDADVLTPMGFRPPQDVLDQVPAALLKGLGQGVHDALKDLVTPSNYRLISPETMTDVLGPLLRTVTAAADLHESPSEILNYLSVYLEGVGNWFKQGLTELSFTHTGIPPVDMASAAFLTLPKVGVELIESELAAGHPLDAIGEPIAAVVGLAPLMLLGALF